MKVFILKGASESRHYWILLMKMKHSFWQLFVPPSAESHSKDNYKSLENIQKALTTLLNVFAINLNSSAQLLITVHWKIYSKQVTNIQTLEYSNNGNTLMPLLLSFCAGIVTSSSDFPSVTTIITAWAPLRLPLPIESITSPAYVNAFPVLVPMKGIFN